MCLASGKLIELVRPSLPATNAKRLHKGVQRRSNPAGVEALQFAEEMDCFAGARNDDALTFAFAKKERDRSPFL